MNHNQGSNTVSTDLTDAEIDAIAFAVVYGGEPSTPYRADWCEDIGRPFARAIISAISAAPSARPSVPPGWKLVPVEPTWEMCTAEWNVSMSDAHTEDGVSACAWAAMLAAAPQAPAPSVAQTMLNGLTEAETAATRSVSGLSPSVAQEPADALSPISRDLVQFLRGDACQHSREIPTSECVDLRLGTPPSPAQGGETRAQLGREFIETANAIMAEVGGKAGPAPAQGGADEARLNWLESHPYAVRHGLGYRSKPDAWFFEDHTGALTSAPTLRAAIDDAMTAPQGKEQA